MCDAFQKWNNWLRRSRKPALSAVVKSSTDHEYAQPLEVVPPAKTACSQVTYQPIPPAKMNSSVKSTRSISSGVAISLPVDLAEQLLQIN